MVCMVKTSWAKIAIDIVLLPPEEIMEKAIAINRELVKQGSLLELDKEKNLPHISLAMGRIEEKSLPIAEKILKELVASHLPIGINVREITADPQFPVSQFQIKKSIQLLNLHEAAMKKFLPLFSYDLSESMFYNGKARKGSVDYASHFSKMHSFENFQPHLTLGIGANSDYRDPKPFAFTCRTLALSHLGNYNTSAKVLLRVDKQL